MKIELNDSYLIGSGTNRACYTHPDDSNKGIKVTISGNHKETNREIKQYLFLQKRDISWDMLAKFYGTVETNLGKGEVVELIKDYDENISKSLDDYFRKITSVEDIKRFIDLLFELKEYLYREKIYVKDLNAVNVVYQKFDDKNGRLVIIDGLAHSNYVPFSRYIDSLKMKKVDKSWKHFIYKLKKRCSTKYNPDLKSELDKRQI
ncbi:MAG: hypothetical protein J7L21_06400 [Sulfurimonas sp.]|nr:hypothetical protein [Sulfurimonas sp.]